MRTDMSIPLPQFFRDTLNKQVTRENVVELCLVAIRGKLIFQYGACNPGIHHIRHDLTDMYCYTREIIFWHPFYMATQKTIAMYDETTLLEGDNLSAIFDTLDTVFSQIQELLLKNGMPKL